MGLVDRYRANWPRVGGLLAMAGAGGVALTHRRMSMPQTLSALNLLALFVHQYEEYEDPAASRGSSTGASSTATSLIAIR